MTEWRNMTAGDLGRAISRGAIDPIALTEEYLNAIKSHDAGPRIYARLTEDRALAEADAAAKRAKAGQRLSALDGVPVSWKDLVDTAGVATEAGSLLLEDRVPGRDAAVLCNATAQGLICLGKTHMTELAFSGLGLNPMTATPPNLHDPALVPGGSSSGAAASVAFALAAAAVGSDTGGSVRIPAAWNDLVGLKTTSGRLSLDGVVPLVASFDTIGPLTRNVEDAALMLAAFEGTKPADLRGASLKGARFMVLETVALEDCRDAPLAAFEEALLRLAAHGAVIERRTMADLTDLIQSAGPLFTTEAYATWRDVIEDAPDKMFAPICERFRAGRTTKGADFVAGWKKVQQGRKVWAEHTAGYDAVLLPTSPIMPPNAARLLEDHAYFISENLMALRNTRIGNILGLSALTLPTATPSAGITLMGQPFGEERLLRLGAAAETALRL